MRVNNGPSVGRKTATHTRLPSVSLVFFHGTKSAKQGKQKWFSENLLRNNRKLEIGDVSVRNEEEIKAEGRVQIEIIGKEIIMTGRGANCTKSDNAAGNYVLVCDLKR